jgi:hypothetical protein
MKFKDYLRLFTKDKNVYCVKIILVEKNLIGGTEKIIW